jgi:intracellular multiplication protein IcmX
MKLGRQFFLVHLLCLTTMYATAQTYTNPGDPTNNQSTTKLLQSVVNWAAVLGYDITGQQTPPLAPTQLLDYANASLAHTLLFNTYFGAIPVTPLNSNGGSQAGSNGPFVSQEEPGAPGINAQANFTFQNYSSAGKGSNNSSSSTDVVANALIDQPPFQTDPITQSLLNVLGTPDVSYCLNSNGTTPSSNNGASGRPTCPYLTDVSPQPISQNQVTENVIGALPTQTEFFTFATNSAILPQLNSNSLIAPLTYDTQNASTSTNQQNSGLVAQNQLQQAVNFIRYVSGSVSPTLLPSYSAYQFFYAQTQSHDPTQQAHGKAILSAYLTSLRVYAAQTSVGLSNLYYILSKRIPQQVSKPADGGGTGGSGASQSSGLASITSPSQALNEYNMATWRLSNPAAKTGGQWIDKINGASPATVQKEIAVLLSEINYQLYLNRQIEERMLMTSSVSLLQGTKAGQPSSDLSNQNTSSSTNTAAPNAQ